MYTTEYYDFIDEYVQKNLSRYTREYQEQDFITGYVIILPSNKDYCNDWLFLLETKSGYMPIIRQNIDKSSYLSTWITEDIQDDQQEISEYGWTLEQLLDIVIRPAKNGLRKILVDIYFDRMKDE